MAEVIIPAGYGNAVLKWNVFGRSNPYTVTFGFKDDGAGIDTPSEIADTFMTEMTGTGAPAAPAQMYTTWGFLGVGVIVNRANVFYSGDSTLPGNAGSVTSVQEPVANSSLLVAKGTGIAGRRFRGRIYPPFTKVPGADINRYGDMLSGTTGPLQTQWALFRTNMAATDYPLYLLHSHADDAPTPITNLIVRAKVGTQRRRIR